MREIRSRRTLATAIALITFALLARPASADSMYNPSKTIEVDAKGNPSVTWQYFTDVWIAKKAGGGIDSKSNPAAAVQTKGWDPFGKIGFEKKTNRLFNQNVEVFRGSKDVPAKGLSDSKPVSVGVKPLSAEADSIVDIKPVAAGNPVEGTIKLDGKTTVQDEKRNVTGQAYSFSDGLVTVSGVDKDGKVTVAQKSQLLESTTGRTFDSDPILFQVADYITGETILEGSLLDTIEELFDVGSLTWADGMFSIDAINADFYINASSPYIPSRERGTLDLVIANGLIAQSDATGIFAGIFPGVGKAGTFSVPLSNTLIFDYDFGDFGDRLVNVTLQFDQAAGAFEGAAVPEPASLSLLGMGVVGMIGYRRKRCKCNHLTPRSLGPASQVPSA